MNIRRKWLLIAGLIFWVVAAGFLIHALNRPVVRGIQDLSMTSGRIASYSFHDGPRGKHLYVIHLAGYAATFQIPAECVDGFSKMRFHAELRRGDLVYLAIPKGSEKKLEVEGRIDIFSVRAKLSTYLSQEETIRKYNDRSSLLVFGGLFLVGTGLVGWAVKR